MKITISLMIEINRNIVYALRNPKTERFVIIKKTALFLPNMVLV